MPIDYVYWLLRTPQYREYCRAHATGTTNLGFPRDDFLAFPVPALTPIRRTIVDILTALDDKIELNRRMNETLETTVGTLFRSWFVDFDPVQAKIDGRSPPISQSMADLFPGVLLESELGRLPEGWSVGSVGDIASAVRRGVDPADLGPGTPYIGLEHMPRRSVSLTEWGVSETVKSSKSAFKKGEILFGKLRPYFHKVGLAPVSGVCSTDIVVIAPKNATWAAFVLAVVSSVDFVSYTDQTSNGTKMPRTSWKSMSRYPLLLPPERLAQAFQNMVAPMLSRVSANIHNSRNLDALRNTLLSRLFPGTLSSADAGRFPGARR